MTDLEKVLEAGAELAKSLVEAEVVIKALHSENAALRAAITRIRNLHQIGTYYSDVLFTLRSSFTGCVQCEQAWPCPTITAIGPLP